MITASMSHTSNTLHLYLVLREHTRVGGTDTPCAYNTEVIPTCVADGTPRVQCAHTDHTMSLSQHTRLCTSGPPGVHSPLLCTCIAGDTYGAQQQQVHSGRTMRAHTHRCMAHTVSVHTLMSDTAVIWEDNICTSYAYEGDHSDKN